MEYPKQLMKLSELSALGFSMKQLREYVHQPGCPCMRTGNTKNSHYLIDTTKFDDWLEEQKKAFPYSLAAIGTQR